METLLNRFETLLIEITVVIRDAFKYFKTVSERQRYAHYMASNRSSDVLKRILCALGSKDMHTICRKPVTIRKTKRVQSYHVSQNDPFRRPFGASPGTSPEQPSGAATEPLGSWYGAGAEPVRSRYRAGTELVRHRYGAAMEPVRGWYAGSAGTEAVSTKY